ARQAASQGGPPPRGDREQGHRHKPARDRRRQSPNGVSQVARRSAGTPGESNHPAGEFNRADSPGSFLAVVAAFADVPKSRAEASAGGLDSPLLDFALALAVDAAGGEGQDQQTLLRDLRVAVFAQSVGALVEPAERVIDATKLFSLHRKSLK